MKFYTNIHVASFSDAALYSAMSDIPPTIIISIDDFGFFATPFEYENINILGILKLQFSDVDDAQEYGDIAMTPEDAKLIVSFVRKYLPYRPEILIHCALGRSRSAGVAAALHRWLNGNDSPIMDSPYRNPNLLCYTRVLDAAEVPYDINVEKKRFEDHSKWVDRFFYDDELYSEDNEDIVFPCLTEEENNASWISMLDHWHDEHNPRNYVRSIIQRGVHAFPNWDDRDISDEWFALELSKHKVNSIDDDR